MGARDDRIMTGQDSANQPRPCRCGRCEGVPCNHRPRCPNRVVVLNDVKMSFAGLIKMESR